MILDLFAHTWKLAPLHSCPAAQMVGSSVTIRKELTKRGFFWRLPVRLPPKIDFADIYFGLVPYSLLATANEWRNVANEMFEITRSFEKAQIVL